MTNSFVSVIIAIIDNIVVLKLFSSNILTMAQESTFAWPIDWHLRTKQEDISNIQNNQTETLQRGKLGAAPSDFLAWMFMFQQRELADSELPDQNFK